jgi:glycosyltransferase involved in cell wall biosynthesis
MNLPFCWWVWKRAARHGDNVEIMVHEPFLDLWEGTLRQRAVGLVHRLLTIILLRSAKRVWMSIPAWERCWRPYALGRRVPFHWLPIPSNIPVVNNQRRAHELRQRYAPDGPLIGHFGTYGTVSSVLEPILALLGSDPVPQMILLMGMGSQEYRDALIRRQPQLSGRIQATGVLPSEDLSCHIAACDLMIQPYPDGVSSRRTSFMAGLSHGKPVVTTAGPATEDIWATLEAAAMAPAGDAAGFVGLVRRYRDDAQGRARMAVAARRIYQDNFELPHVITKLRAAAAETPILA